MHPAGRGRRTCSSSCSCCSCCSSSPPSSSCMHGSLSSHSPSTASYRLSTRSSRLLSRASSSGQTSDCASTGGRRGSWGRRLRASTCIILAQISIVSSSSSSVGSSLQQGQQYRVPPRGFVGTFHSPGMGKLADSIESFPQVSVPQLKLPEIRIPKVSVQGVCNFLAGGVAGAVASAITCPLEVVKTNLQSRANAGLGLNPLGVGAKILKEQGVGGLYRGLSLSLVGIIPTRSCYFWAYGATKSALEPVIGDGPATHMASAVAAGGLSSTVTCPLWMVKTRMQLQGTGMVATARKILTEEGPKGLYRGLLASYWGLSEGAVQFLLYEKMKASMKASNLESSSGSKELTTWQYLLAAGTSKAAASILTYPHEVVRTRMREAASTRYRSMFQSIALIAREEGRRGLYSGLGPHLMRVVPNTAIMFMSFELLSRQLPTFLENKPWEKTLENIQNSLSVAPVPAATVLAMVGLGKERKM